MKTKANNPNSECLNPPHEFECKKCGLFVGAKVKTYLALHPIQQKIFSIIENKEVEIDKMTLREIGKIVGDTAPQKIKHHLNMLIRYGYVDIIQGKYRVHT